MLLRYWFYTNVGIGWGGTLAQYYRGDGWHSDTDTSDGTLALLHPTARDGLHQGLS